MNVNGNMLDLTRLETKQIVSPSSKDTGMIISISDHDTTELDILSGSLVELHSLSRTDFGVFTIRSFSPSKQHETNFFYKYQDRGSQRDAERVRHKCHIRKPGVTQ